jgi:hypothetical protein
MASDFEAQLRTVSLRVIRPRLAVLAALGDRAHVDTDTVIALVRAELPRVSHQAVYDVLRALTNAGWCRASSPPVRPPATSHGWGTTTTMSCAAPAVRSRTSTAPSSRGRLLGHLTRLCD